MSALDGRLRQLIADGASEITADDITERGQFTLDATHAANSRQSGIGSAFREWANSGYIERTGRVVRSAAPHRKGGMIQVWQVTDTGRDWAIGLFGIVT